MAGIIAFSKTGNVYPLLSPYTRSDLIPGEERNIVQSTACGTCHFLGRESNSAFWNKQDFFEFSPELTWTDMDMGRGLHVHGHVHPIFQR